MSYYNGLPSGSDTVTLPNGVQLITRVLYTQRESNGVIVLVVISCISLIAVVGLLTAIAISAFNTRKSTEKNLFVRTHVAYYFISLLIADILQAIGSILNAPWVRNKMVEIGPICTAQAVIKQTSDVGAALWVLVIAIHTFCLLFLQIKIRPYALWATLVFGWSTIFTIVLIGPAGLNTQKRGPFFGISGYWCWISPEYQTERVTLDYFMMFFSAFTSFILYTLVFLRLRGNIVVTGWRVTFKRSRSNGSWPASSKSKKLLIARQMLLYPVAYTILILPIAAVRFSTWAGKDVPFEGTIFGGAVFLLSGIVNVTLFSTTRRVLPPQSLKFPWSRTQETDTTTNFSSSFGGSTTVSTYSEKPFNTYSAPPSMKHQSLASDASSVVFNPQTEIVRPPPPSSVVFNPPTEIIRPLPPVPAPSRPRRVEGDGIEWSV